MFVLMLWFWVQGEIMSGGCTLANVLNQEKGYLSSDAVQISPAPQTPHYGPFERPPGQIHSTYQSNQM